MAAIGDEDSITGLLLAGIGHIDSHQKKNFLVVDASTYSFPLILLIAELLIVSRAVFSLFACSDPFI
jgi:hypothetical protein